MSNKIRRLIQIVEGKIDVPVNSAELLASRINAMNLPARVTVIPLNDHTAEITDLLSVAPGNGSGRKTMKAILALADELQITLEAWPVYDEEIDGLSQDALEAWYTRLGFRCIPNRDSETSDPNSDDYLEIDRYLVRLPKA